MEEGLREGISVLTKCDEAAELLETKIMEYRQEMEIQTLIRELMMMRARISKLLQQARQGLDIIQDAKIEVARQAKEVEEHKIKIAKLDHWLETIDNELKESTKQTDVWTEEDIIKYIEIYERYIREYEEYEIILKSITLFSVEKSSQSLEEKLKVTQQSLVETKNLVIVEIERLRRVLLQIRSAAEIVEEDVSQTDRTIDSTSMPEEIASPRESEIAKELETLEGVQLPTETPGEKGPSEPIKKVHSETKFSPDKVPSENKTLSEKKEPSEKLPSDKASIEKKVVTDQIIITEDKPVITIETQTGRSLMSDSPAVTDKSIMCEPEKIMTQDVSITCAPPCDIEIQTSDPITDKDEILENIKIRKTISGDHETFEIESRPVVRKQLVDEQSLLVDANYRDVNQGKETQLNIMHSLPQSFETVMVEPDETTTEVVVDADGTKRIIVRKVRKTLVTRQQMVHSHRHTTGILDGTQDQSFSQITLKEDKGSTSTMLEDGEMQRVEYQQFGSQIISGLPGSEVTIQEFTSKPGMVVKLEEGLNPEEILQLAESDGNAQIQTSSSSVTAVVQQVTKRIVKTKRRIIRRIVFIDGKEHVTEEVIDEPDNVEVFEEQIPRVSINVIDQGGVQFEEIDNDHDNDNKLDLPDLSKNIMQSREKTPKPDDDENKDNKSEDKDKLFKDTSYKPTTKTYKQEPSKVFIEMESQRQSQFTKSSDHIKQSTIRQTSPIESVAISETYENIPEENQSRELYYVQEPQDNQTTFTSEGYHHSTFETSSSNTATVVQKVTRKITRTKRRIIKHIQIIDGKEHVTEEVIDEPDDVEIIEEEPKVSTHTVQEQGVKIKRIKKIRHVQVIDGKEHVTEEVIDDPDDVEIIGAEPKVSTHIVQEQGVKTKRIKIIRQVQVIDGKEHVTEHIVEEPDDEYVPETTITTEIDVNIGRFPTIIPEDTDEDIDKPHAHISKNSQKTVIDETKKLISSEILQSSKTLKSAEDQNAFEIHKSNENTGNIHESNIKEHELVVTQSDNEAKEPDGKASSLVEIAEPVQEKKVKKKKGKKTLPTEPEVLQVEQELDIQCIGSEKVESSKDQSHQTINETSDICIANTVLTETQGNIKEFGESVSTPVTVEITQSKSVAEISSPDRKSKSVSPSKRVTFVDKLIESTVPGEVSKIIEPELKCDKISPEPSKFISKDFKTSQDLHVSEKEFIISETPELITKPTEQNVKAEVGTVLDFISNERAHALHPGKCQPESAKTDETSQDTKSTIQDLVKTVHSELSKKQESSKRDKKKLQGTKVSPIFDKTEVQSEQEAPISTEAKSPFKSQASTEPKSDLLDKSKLNKLETEQSILKSPERPQAIAESKTPENIIGEEGHIIRFILETEPDTRELVPKDDSLIITGPAFNTPQNLPIISTSSDQKLETSTTFIDSEIAAAVHVKQQTKEINEEEIKKKESIIEDSTDAAKDTKQEKPEEVQVIKLIEDESKQDAKKDIKTDYSKVIDEVSADKQSIQLSGFSQINNEIKPFMTDKTAEPESSNKVKLSFPSHKNLGKVTEDLLTSEKQSLGPQLSSQNKETIESIHESALTGFDSQVYDVKTEVVSGQTTVKSKTTPIVIETESKDGVLVIPTEMGEIINITAKKSDSKYDSDLLLESERHDTHIRELKPSVGIQSVVTEMVNKPTQLQQTVDISMSLSKTDAEKNEPKVQVGLKVEGFETKHSVIVKKDIDVNLPSNIKVTRDHPKQPLAVETSPKTLVEASIKERPLTPVIAEEIVRKDTLSAPEIKMMEIEQPSTESSDSSKDHKKSKKKKKRKPTPDESFADSNTSEVPMELPTETDKSVIETDSSSLSHYVVLPTSPHLESPKPTDDVLEPETESLEPDSFVESERAPEEKGYEAEEVSQGPTPVPKKRQKKRKPHAVSEDTTYPKESTAESDGTSVSSPVETAEPLKEKKDKKKKGKKQLPIEPEVLPESQPDKKPESPKIGSENVDSPKDESYHTMSETSDISTVKIVEECVQSSPETLQKDVSTTVTFTVPVIEEIPTQEYSVQTSPELTEPIKDAKEELKPESVAIELQTSPIPISETVVQTTPREEKEADTQTIQEIITVAEKVPVIDTEIQTSRPESPQKIIQAEATTQVISQDIVIPEEKFSQTLSPIEGSKDTENARIPEVVTESKEMQTSPLPEVQRDEKSTEMIIETAETNIQTSIKIVDQETCTTPIEEKEVAELSIQTPNIPVVSTFTQSDEQEITVIKTTLSPKPVVADVCQQTSPRISEFPDDKSSVQEEIVPILDLKKLTTCDSIQQTTPREPDVYKVEIPVTPRPVHLDLGKKEILTSDSTQQTSPRVYSEDSISTSTDEPYEVHLRAQITIPEATNDFLDNERQMEPPQSILGDRQKQKKRKHKRKMESPVAQTPESLSDPITTELLMSVTTTSEDYSIKDTSSIDEGISQLASPVSPDQQETFATHKLTYSDVVQRSKSKSPSPTKSIHFSRKPDKARLLDALEKRTQSLVESPRNIPDHAMTVAVLDQSVEKSYDAVVNKELESLKDNVRTNDPTRVERSVVVIIETISIWLEEIQYQIQRETITNGKAVNETRRLASLQGYIQSLKEIIEITEVNEEIVTLIEMLTRQADAVSTLNSQSPSTVKEVEKDWIKFLDDTDKLFQSVQKVKFDLDDIILADIPTQQKLDHLDKLENVNIINSDIVTKMFRRYRILVETNARRECPANLFTCDDDTKQVENSINTERDRLLQLSALAEEYEQTLQDFGQITDVAEALLDGKIIVSDLDHLHEEIQKHRKFFVNLSHCRAILESLEDNLDSETRSKYSSLHNSLHDRATTIIDRAAGRAQQMTLAASRWTTLEQSMKEEQQWLRVAQQRIPDLTNVTSIDHEQYINLYQSVSLDVSHHHAKILRLLSITDGLQNLIFCSGLESECSLALDTLLKLQEDVDFRLIRLTAFKENWMTYDFIIERIENWMKIANRELEHLTPDNITTTGNLRRFWELKAQHKVHNNLKNESGVQFEKALEILPISDEMVQRQFFSKIEDEWRELAAKIDNLHSSAIQSISDRDVSSGEKLNILEDEIRELRASLDSLKTAIRSEDELNLYIERLQVMTGRVDRIQNELGRLSLLPTAESDRLGALLSQSRNLDDQIAEELERSMLLKEKIVLVQAGITRCQKSQRRARLTIEECEAAERLGSDVVERASETCDRLLEDLAAQWRDIRALNQALHTLPTCLRVTVSLTDLERDINGLQETHGHLEAEASELSARLRAKVQLWRRFERQLELVQGAVREADYMAELLTVQGQVDYDRLLKATEKLETLSQTLSRRSGELVGELRASAAPLAASTEPAVAARLQRDLDDAVAAYEHTCNNLTQLCNKYHKAVDMWKRYRDAAATVRAFTEQQEGTLHALRPEDAPSTAQACLEQEARVAELRSLAARVAEETGSRALQADADALARRLQLVAGAVQALADLGEARQLARAKAQHVTEQFSDMRQDLTPLHEDGEIVEDQLIALRQNLIALGKSEANIVPAKEHLPDIDRDVSEEHSIVRILELWQAMFRDTFLHYHRLSTALVRSGDAATALRLWHEYLLDLQSFLSGSVPADYENLTEHRRLCRVHRNLLASQRSVLINEHKETKHRDLVERFDTLTNLHNETLARIVERHDEVSTRIAAWDDYREIYIELLRWLTNMEREKEKLQLRYVHIKRIQKILTKVQNLADQMPEGRKQGIKLSENLKKILEFTEQAYGASVRMEYAGLVKRVDNLHASLDTWRDFLTRILGLIGEYENLTNDLHKLYSKTQDETMSYSDEDRLSRPQLKKAIEKYTDLRTKINKTETQIEALSVIQEQLKECLSPQDIRTVNQRVWQLRQQRADLEHQLTIIIHRLQERLEVYTIFDSRLLRFAEWLTTLEARLETTSQNSNLGTLDPQDLIRRITSDVEAETAMKEREFEWLTETGNVLVDLSKKDEKSFSKTTSKQLSEINGRWHKLQESGRARIAKITELLETIMQLEERLTEIRLKLHTIESNLTTTVILQVLTARAVDEKFQERDEIHKNIEMVSGEVGETLNLCQLVFNDPDVLRGNFDLRNLRTGVDIVEKKWKNICNMSEHRKNTLKEIRKSAELANSLLPKVEKKLDSIEKRVEKIEARKQKGEKDDESVSKAVVKDLEASKDDVNRLEDAYSRVASARGVELRGEAADYAARLRSAVRRWQQLRGRVDAAGADARRRFVAAHGRAVIALAEADVHLTRALHLAPTPLDKVATLAELMGVEQELVECEALVREADQLAAAAGAGVAEMEAEYRMLYADVRTRLDVARADIVSDVDSAVQVDTLKWETDASLQVDTLTSKETYRVELASAVKEASDCLEALRTALMQQPKENAGSDELATAAKNIAKAGAKPGQILELAKHLSELLLTECDATEEEAMLKEVESLALRYEDLLAQAKKRELQINNLRLPHSASYALTCEHESGRLTCPLCSERNWKQLDNDLWRLEQWLQFAEATEEGRGELPEVYDQLEDAIQDHREFLLDLDSHKSIVVSLNVVGAHVAAHAAAPADAARVRTRLAAANARWDAACAAAGVWQGKLQRALVHNQQFHDIVVELVARLAAAERGVRAREPLRLNRPPDELQRDFRRFSELRDELSRAEPRVHALHDAAQLLRGGDAPPSSDDICRRLGELRLRLQSLRKLSGVYALKLGAALARQPRGAALSAAPQLMEEEEEQISGLDLPPLDENDVVVTDDEELTRLQRGLRFVCRVARASLPFQALLLILLGAAALAPHSSSDCRTPGLALEPVLRYPDGPPPL